MLHSADTPESAAVEQERATIAFHSATLYPHEPVLPRRVCQCATSGLAACRVHVGHISRDLVSGIRTTSRRRRSTGIGIHDFARRLRDLQRETTWSSADEPLSCAGTADDPSFSVHAREPPSQDERYMIAWRHRSRGTSSCTREVTIVANDVAPIGGMERQLTELVAGILQRGVRVTVIARRCELPPHPALRFIRVAGPSRPFVVAYPWFFVFASILTLRHRRGVLHTTGAIVMNRAEMSTVHHLHHGTHAKRGFVSRSRSSLPYRLNALCAEPLKRAGERWCYRPAVTGHVVGDSQGLARELSVHFPLMAAHTSVIPLGVDHGRGDDSSDQRDAVRATLTIHAGQHLALFVGGDWERKGLRLAIEAIAKTPDWHLLVVGSGDIMTSRRIAAAAGSEARTHFAGTPSGTAPYYAAADAFLLPTAYETFSLVTYEAAAAGLPLLVTRVSGVEDLLVDGKNGWFVERDPAQIADRLDALGANADLRRRMGESARRAVQGYSWAAAVDSYYALYASIGKWLASPPSSRTDARGSLAPPPIAAAETLTNG
jgi:glycosyltransferase involved in cell wall biosynthesis